MVFHSNHCNYYFNYNNNNYKSVVYPKSNIKLILFVDSAIYRSKFEYQSQIPIAIDDLTVNMLTI